MQSRTISKDPIDFPLIDIKVEKVDTELKAYCSKHDNLKDALLACEFEYEQLKYSTNNHFNNIISHENFYSVDIYDKLFYVVSAFDKITNMTGDF